MEVSEIEFNIQERNILSALYSAEKPLTTERVSRIAGISRITARKYLDRLKNRGVLKSVRMGKGIYWWILTEKKTVIERRRRKRLRA